MLASLTDRLKALLAANPAALLYGLAALLPPLLEAFGASKPVTGAVVTIATALASAISAVKARPVALPVILGAAGAVVGALAAFGLHFDAATTAGILAGLNLALAFAFHLALTPVISTPEGKAREQDRLRRAHG